jgi:hypothetical protein
MALSVKLFMFQWGVLLVQVYKINYNRKKAKKEKWNGGTEIIIN